MNKENVVCIHTHTDTHTGITTFIHIHTHIKYIHIYGGRETDRKLFALRKE